MILISVYAAKIISIFIRIFNLGAGYVVPGHLVLKFNKRLLSPTLFDYPGGVVLVSGTNGKTTTTKLITHILRTKGLKVDHNKSGANLVNGLVTSLLLSRNLLGRVTADVGVFEVDEFALPYVLEVFSPKALVLLNLSRDQLDRYGETDTVLHRWKEALAQMSAGGGAGAADGFESSTLILDASQRKFEGLPGIFSGTSVAFSGDVDVLEGTSLRGDFNAKNINAALEVAHLFGISSEDAISSLSNFSAAYGRGELIEYAGKNFTVFLAKNPSSFNQNLLALPSVKKDAVLIVLNDNIPDGRDISWIYDIKAHLLAKSLEGVPVYVAGTRALEMAVRLKYAGVSVGTAEDSIFNSVGAAIKHLSTHKAGVSISTNAAASADDATPLHDIVVLPNYSAMLETRKVLLGRKIL